MNRIALKLLVACVCWFALGWAQANEGVRYRALLVGVSEYPHLTGKDLRGPREDVTRMSEQLARRGVRPDAMVVLTESGDPNRLPTRKRIMDELTRLAQTAQPGDYIVIMMAGHGSRSPVPAGSPFQEPDGLFEIFLPRDVTGWDDRANGGDGDVVNAIKDHEIRALVDQMVAKGAFVWAIFDACHSATLVRGGDVVLRQIEPTDLRIPQRRVTEAENRAKTAPKPPTREAAVVDQGRAVYFYAAQTTEQAPEMRLPREVPGSPVQGLFSFSLIRALEAGVPMTYRQLSQYVLMTYASTPEARAVTPAFSGGRGLDTPVLGTQAPVVQQWPLVRDPQSLATRLEIRAGTLSQVRPGAEFQLFKSALDGATQSLGRAVVLSASASEARLAMLDAEGKPDPKRPIPEGAAVARLHRAVLDFELAVSVDLTQCAAPCAFGQALKELQGGRVSGVSARWVAAGSAADLALRADGRRLWLQPAGYDPREECRPLRGAAHAECIRKLERMYVHIDADATATVAAVKDAIAGALHRAARATNLMRIGREQSLAGPSQRLAASVTPVSEGSAQQAAAGTAVAAGLPAGAISTVRQGTRLKVTVRNEPGADGRRRPLDITVLWVDSKFGVGVLWPAAGEFNRVQPGDTISFEVDIDQGEAATLGPEQLAVIGVEAEAHSAPQDFSFLAQPAVQFERGGVRTRGAGGFEEFFADAGFADFRTRGATPRPSPAGVGMRVIPLRIVP